MVGYSFSNATNSDFVSPEPRIIALRVPGLMFAAP